MDRDTQGVSSPWRVPTLGGDGAVQRGDSWMKYLWFAVGLVLLAALVWAIRPDPNAQTARSRFGSGPMPVGVARATSGDVNVTLNALGTVTPLATVTVRPQVSGAITKVLFTEGQMVKAGDELAEIDPRTYQAALDQARGVLAKDEAALANAKTDLVRYQTLYAEKAISQQTVATQQSLVKQDQGVIISDQANVSSAAVNAEYTKVTSPVTGRAGLRQIDIGNLVTAGQATQIVTITQEQPISVLFSLPEDDVDSIMEQVHAGAILSVDAYDRGLTKKLASGKLSAVDNQIDPTTGTVKLRAMFDNADGSLFPSQFVNVKLLVQTLHDQTIVPVAAIQRGAEGTYVYVVDPQKAVHMRTVALGTTDGNNVAIANGLKPGDTVVIDGADRLRDGAPVTIPNNTNPITAPSNAPAGAAASAGHHRGGMFALFRKLTPAERTQIQGMDRDARRAWMEQHRAELMKRPDQPAPPGGWPNRGGGGGGGGP